MVFRFHRYCWKGRRAEISANFSLNAFVTHLEPTQQHKYTKSLLFMLFLILFKTLYYVQGGDCKSHQMRFWPQ
jgi:hypothetical protein